MLKPIIKKGDKFNRLTAIKFIEKRRTDQYWLFKCECGKEKVISVYGVKSGHSKSCGCYKNEKSAERLKTHGMYGTRTYRIWKGMKQRCLNKNHKKYKDYGGRGIMVCERWMNFQNFFADMGEVPEGLTLDRIENNLGYNKKNCRYTTWIEQHNNKRNNHFITYNNKTQTIAQWVRELKVTRWKFLNEILKTVK